MSSCEEAEQRAARVRFTDPRIRSVGVDLSDRKIIIAGTGRAGTTFLVAVLTDLGLDTGYEPGAPMNGVSGGMERSIGHWDTPRVVKSPGLSTRLGPLLDGARSRSST